MPKINSWFYRAQKLVLPDFCPNPLHAREALRIYIKRTQSFRHTEALFVSFLASMRGQKLTTSALGRLIRATIARVYDA